MNTDSPSFCVMPWVHLHANPDGVATLCCQSHRRLFDAKGQVLNLQTHTMREIWESESLKEIRRRMSAGEQLPHCDACFNVEKFGRRSYRMISNERWLVEHARAGSVSEAIHESSEGATNHTPLTFDLKLGNVCNLKCTVCKPLYSSQIERDGVHSPWVLNATYTRHPNRFGTDGDWSESPALVDEIFAISDNLSAIQLAGGEPTMNKTQMRLLAKLCESGQAADIDLNVSTNLVNVRDEIYELFARFRSLDIYLSIDGTESVYEYVRFPGKWQSLVRNVARLRQTQAKARISLNVVLQAINALNLAALFDWAAEADIPVILDIGRSLDHYNDFRILPPAVSAEAKRRIDDHLKRHSNRGNAAFRENVRIVFDEMEATDFPEPVRRERLTNLMQFINDLDQSRGLSFRTVAPEIHDGIVAYAGQWDPRTRYASN